MKNCLRCGTESVVSAIGAALYHFVCDDCRRDVNQWHLGWAVTREAMEYMSPLPELNHVGRHGVQDDEGHGY